LAADLFSATEGRPPKIAYFPLFFAKNKNFLFCAAQNLAKQYFISFGGNKLLKIINYYFRWKIIFYIKIIKNILFCIENNILLFWQFFLATKNNKILTKKSNK
jgi:hypothetical protein